jgi:GNAT superfamily N-acetyltransferase
MKVNENNDYEIVSTRILTDEQNAQIDVLWNEEYPLKLQNRFGLLLLDVKNHDHYWIEKEGRILAWAVSFEKEEEIRFSIIVSSKYKGLGLGSKLLRRLLEEHQQIYGWVIDHDSDLKKDGTNYKSPLSFYLKNGFHVLIDKRIDTEIIKAVKVYGKLKT